MHLRLHANAKTTPRTRAYIRRSKASIAELARELGVSGRTIARWRERDSTEDRSHRPHRVATTMTEVEQQMAVELRSSLALPLDDIVEVMRRCHNPKLSRSQVHRCLQRHGVSARPKAEKPPAGRFETAGIGFIHVDLKQIVADRSAATIAACLERFLAAFPHPVHTILTDNGSEFTDRFGAARWRSENQPSGRHPFDCICARHGIAHRLTRPFRPQTNGMVERFNRRLTEAIAAKPSIARNQGKNKFANHAERDAFLIGFVSHYNRTRLRCINWRAPAELLANPPGHNANAGTQCLAKGWIPAFAGTNGVCRATSITHGHPASSSAKLSPTSVAGHVEEQGPPHPSRRLAAQCS
jgi:transposase InsO family protein